MKIKKNNGDHNDPNPVPDAGAPWPCPRPSPTPPAWPETRPVSHPPVSPVTNVLKLQQKATNAFRESFVESGSAVDEPNDDSEEEEDYSSDVGDEKFQFFLRVFVEDDELRRYYEENFELGEFFCLVCGGIGGKGSGKRFKSCHRLVQHASAVSKIETSRSHLAFGQVVCSVLGWDFDKIPIVVTKGESLSRTLGNGDGEKKHDETFGGVVKEESDDVKVNVVSMNNIEAETVEKEGVDKLQIGDGKFPEEKDAYSNRDEENPSEDQDGGQNESKDENEVSCENSQGFKQPQESSTAIVGWPTPTPNLGSAASSLSAEEQAMLAADQLQHKAVKLCKAFLTANSSSDSTEDEEEDSSEDNESENEDSGTSSGDSEELNFFSKLFSDDAELREFYISNSEGRDFCCLVCGGIGKKVWKRFAGCVALVQHSASISKTRKKRAHRAYGHAICQILGWDVNRKPSIASKGESFLPEQAQLDG